MKKFLQILISCYSINLFANYCPEFMTSYSNQMENMENSERFTIYNEYDSLNYKLKYSIEHDESLKEYTKSCLDEFHKLDYGDLDEKSAEKNIFSLIEKAKEGNNQLEKLNIFQATLEEYKISVHNSLPGIFFTSEKNTSELERFLEEDHIKRFNEKYNLNSLHINNK